MGSSVAAARVWRGENSCTYIWKPGNPSYCTAVLIGSQEQSRGHRVYSRLSLLQDYCHFVFFLGGGSGCLLCSREFTSIPVLPQDVTTSYVSRHCWMFLGGLSCPRRTTVVHEDKCPRILLCERESAFTLRPK